MTTKPSRISPLRADLDFAAEALKPLQESPSMRVLRRWKRACSMLSLASVAASSCIRSQAYSYCSLSSLSGPILSSCGDANDIRGKPSTPSSLRSLRLACDNPPCLHMKDDETPMIHDPKNGPVPDMCLENFNFSVLTLASRPLSC